MTGREDRVQTRLAGIPVSGVSIAGHETWFHFPTLGFVASERRHRLVPSWRGRSAADIREATARGEAVSESWTSPLVAFCGDTSAEIFPTAPGEVFRAKVLLLECSFLEDEHKDRANGWGHLHLSEIAERADLFQNEVLVLTHLTLRTGPAEIRRLLSERLPAGLAARTIPFLP